MPISELLDQLNEVNSQDEGLELILGSAQQLDDNIAEGLFAKANELRSAGDAGGAAEFEIWGKAARSVITRRDLLSKDLSSADDGWSRLNAQRQRFDDAFIEHCVSVASAPMGLFHQSIEDENQEQAEAIAARITQQMDFNVGFLKVIASVTGESTHQAHAAFTEGCWLLLLVKLARLKADQVEDDNVAKRAESALMTCAASEEAPLDLRARAEENLATLAFPDMPKVHAHQEAALQLAEKGQDSELTWSVRRNRVYWARQDKNWGKVYELSKKNLDEAEHAVLEQYSPTLVMDIVRSAHPDILAITQACLELGKTDSAYYERGLEAAEWAKGRAFLRAAMAVATNYKPIPERLIRRRERLIQLSEEWSRTLGLWPSNVAEGRKSELENIQRQIGAVEDQIEEFAGPRALDLRCFPCKFDEMVKLIPPDGVLLSYFVMPERIVLYVLTNGGLVSPPVLIDLDRKTLAGLLVDVQITSAMRADFRDWDKIQREIDMKIDAVWPQDELEFLHHKLVEPIVKHVVGRSVVYLSLDDLLLELPFQALLAKDGSSLIDAAPIAHIFGVAVLRRCLEDDKDRKRDSVFAAGVSSSLGGPDCSVDEAQAVANFFKDSPRPATCDAVLAQGMSADILHLSCHSNLENALTSFQGLQLEDGALTNAQINAARARATLVVLSACETSRGDLHGGGAELAGFVGAFMRAGCPSVIACMWRMPEEVSLDFANGFYQSLIEEKSSKAAALQAGLLALKKQERFNHPYFWASLCLYGAA